MTNLEAIETLRANYPDACYEQLREAVDKAIKVLEDIVAIPDHGDLIDRDKLMEYKQCVYKFGEYELFAVEADTILKMPVVIPEKRGEE